MLIKDKQSDPAAHRPGRKLRLRIKNTMKNTRNENGIISSFRRIFWHPPSLLREQSLMRGQLSSLPYLTWLSLPFQCFSFIVVFATYSCSFGTGIYTLSLCQNLNDFKGYFCGLGQKTHRGLLQIGEAAGFEHCIREVWVCLAESVNKNNNAFHWT